MFKVLPPKISMPLFYVFITLAYAYKFLFGNIYGIFLTSLLIYFNCEKILGLDPLSFEELMFWVVSQNEGTKSSILGALVTVVGFLIAYATATSNWKSQMLASLKLDAAGEIEVFFSECSRLSTDCKIYAESLVESINEIQTNATVQDASFLASYNREQSHIFQNSRQKLIARNIEVHRLHGKYSALFSTAPGLKSSLNSATKALNSIVDKIWISTPFFIENDQNPIQSYVNQVNVLQCVELSKAIESNIDELNMSSGFVRGNLTSTVIGFNIWSLIALYKDRKSIFEAFSERYRKLQ